MKKNVAIILARGGSRGLPKKNIIDFCGKPLMAWTIEQCLNVNNIDSVWVSSDSEEILSVGKKYGANSIKRPEAESNDIATSEAAWLHAIKSIEKDMVSIDLVVAPQVTSPLRESSDIDIGIEKFYNENFDSMFSCSVAEDLFFWEKQKNNTLKSINYDYLNRKRRQDIPEQYIENGSFYLFKPEVIKKGNNRFGGNIGFTKMEFWKMFEIDNEEDLRMCSALMQEFIIKG